MALNMGKGDLRGLSPGPATPARKPRPFLAHPWKPDPAPDPRSSRRCRVPVLRLSPRSASAPSRPARPSSAAKAQWRTTFARSEKLGEGSSEEAQPRRTHRGFRLDSGGSGAPCAAPPGPLHRDGSGPRESRSSPLYPAETRVRLGPSPGSSLPGRGREPAQPRQSRGQHKHSSVLYSPPN